MIRNAHIKQTCVNVTILTTFLMICLWGRLGITQNTGVSGTQEDFRKMSLEELLQVKISVASKFYESDLVVGSTVYETRSEDWYKYGDRNLLDAISHVPSFFPLPNLWGSAIAVRGYANSLSGRGITHLVDGVPVNNISDGTASYEHPFYTLDLLDKIEIISGPGSSIYGSDSLHGVLSLKTFEHDDDHYSGGVEGGTDFSYRSYVKMSKGIDDDLRIHSAAAIDHQADQRLNYRYTEPLTNETKKAQRKNSYTSGTCVLKAGMDVNEFLDVDVGLYYSRWESDEFPSVGRFFGSGESILRDRDVSGNDSNFYMVRGSFEVDLRNTVTCSLLTYSWVSEINRFLDRSRLAGDFNPTLLYNIKRDTKHGIDLSFKQEENAFNTQWLVMYQHSGAKIEKDYEEYYNTTGDVLLEQQDTHQKGFLRRMNSLACQAKTSFFDRRLYLLYGGRIDDYSDFGTQATPRIGLIYHPWSSWSSKLLYNQAFRAPTPNETLGGSMSKPNSDLKPETIDTYEFVLIRYTRLSRLSIGIFQSKRKNGILVKSIDDPVYRLQYHNRGESHSTGLEMTFDADVKPFLFDVNGTYVDSQDEVRDDSYLAFPKSLLNIGFGYTWRRVMLYVSNRIFNDVHAGPVTLFEARPKRLETYYRADVTAQWERSDRMCLYVSCRNITNGNNVLPSIWSVENGIEDENRRAFIGVRYQL